MKTKLTFSAHELGLDDVFTRLCSLQTEARRANALRFLMSQLMESRHIPQWFHDITPQTPPTVAQFTIRLQLREDDPALARVLQWLRTNQADTYPRQIKHLILMASTRPETTQATHASSTPSPIAQQPVISPKPAPVAVTSPAPTKDASGLTSDTRSVFLNASSFFQSTFEPTQP